VEVQDRGGGTEEEDIDDVGPIGGDEYAGSGGGICRKFIEPSLILSH